MFSIFHIGAALAALALFFIVSAIRSYFKDRAFIRAHNCKPAKAFPQSERIIGWEFFKQQTQRAKQKKFLEGNVERFRTHGNTLSACVLGSTVIMTCEPENIKSILATNFKDFGLGQRLRAFGPLLGRGIFTSDGAHWEHSRALVRPSFTKAQVADLDMLETHIQHMFDKIPKDGSTVDLQTLFYQLTFDSATEFLFGESVGILRSPEGSEQQIFAKTFDFAQTKISTRIRLGMFAAFSRDPEFFDACKKVHNFVDRFVFKALEYRKMAEVGKEEEEKGRYVFLNELAKSTSDPKQLRDEVINILVAGRDTTAGLLSNLFHVLARRPDIWERLQNEVEKLNGEIPDYETLRNMKYLKNFLTEGLRLYPSVPGNSRFAKRNTTIPRGGGPDGLSPIFVKKGRIVGYNVYAMHRRHDIYGPDADEFKPERWDDPALRVGWAYLPFNGGPRICVGQQFALTEAGFTVVRMCQMFKGIENRDDGPWFELLQLTLSSANGTKVALLPRL